MVDESPILLDGRDSVEFVVPVENLSHGAVTLDEIAVSCSCIDLKPPTKTLPLGYKDTLKGRIRLSGTGNDVGMILRAAYHNESMSFARPIALNLKCRRPIEVQMSRVELVGFPRPSAVIQIQQFRRPAEQAFADIICSSTGDPIKVSEVGAWRPLPDSDGFIVRERQIAIESELETGGAQVFLRDSSRDGTSATIIPVTWKGMGDIQLHPTARILTEGHDKEFSVSVTSSIGRSFSIAKVEPPPWLQVANAATRSDSRCSVVFRICATPSQLPATATIPIWIQTDQRMERRSVVVLIQPGVPRPTED